MMAKQKFYRFVECSAKDLFNYKTAFDYAIEAVLSMRELEIQQRKQKKKRKCSIL